MKTQHRGALTCSQIAEGINVVAENARRLRLDAELLLENRRYASAVALAILSIEETGKINVLRGLALARDAKELKRHWGDFQKHTAKNAHWIMLELLQKGARKLDDFLPMFMPNSDHRELLDALKQAALYVDCASGAKWIAPTSAIQPELAKKFVFVAKVFTSAEKAVTAREIELWITHMQAVFYSGDSDAQQSALIAWANAMEAEGLSKNSAKSVERFVKEGINFPSAGGAPEQH